MDIKTVGIWKGFKGNSLSGLSSNSYFMVNQKKWRLDYKLEKRKKRNLTENVSRNVVTVRHPSCCTRLPDVKISQERTFSLPSGYQLVWCILQGELCLISRQTFPWALTETSRTTQEFSTERRSSLAVLCNQARGFQSPHSFLKRTAALVVQAKNIQGDLGKE